MANKSIWGLCCLLHIAWKTSWRRDHSLSGRASLSATTLSWPGMCRALRVTWFLVHQVKILHSKAQSGPDLMPPSLLKYDTTVVLSVSTSTILCMQRSWNSFKARKTALSSRWFICNLLPGRNRVPLVVRSFKIAPHPGFDVSVKIADHSLFGCNGWPVRTMSSCSHHCKCGCNHLGIGITFSGDSGFLHFFFFLRCHCIGLLWSWSRWTYFLWLLVNLSDTNCWTGQASSDSISSIWSWRFCQWSGIGRT